MHFPHFPLEFIQSMLSLVAIAVGGLIAHKINKPTDVDRATILARIAEGAAALVLSLYPGKSWAELLKLTVQQIIAAAGIPTKNAAAIERAAAAALLKHGVTPA